VKHVTPPEPKVEESIEVIEEPAYIAVACREVKSITFSG
jgi:hypothetical protein